MSIDESASWPDSGNRSDDTPSQFQSSAVAVQVREPTPANPVDVYVNFNGNAREYFKIWIVNLCMTLLTLGLFSAWAKVRKKRYVYSNTLLGGTPFQYLAEPIPILKGRVVAVVGFGIYYLSSHYIISLLPYVLLIGLFVAPWVMTRSAAFNARYSAYRNMTFYFDGRYVDAVKALYAWGLIPLLGVAMVLATREKPILWTIASLVFMVYFPWWLRGIKDFIVKHTSFGGKKGEFSATGGQFFKIYFTAGLIIMAVGVPVGVMAAMDFGVFAYTGWAMPWLIVLPIYTGYVLAYAFIKARSANLVWNNIHLGPIRFQSTLKSMGLVKLYVTNALGILISGGLLIPWAVIRTHKYRIDHLQVIQTGTLYQFQESKKDTVEAVGAEAIDIFDMDFSL